MASQHSFANTGNIVWRQVVFPAVLPGVVIVARHNIEIRRGGQRFLVGQYTDGEFRIKREFQSDGPAQNRIQVCLETVARYGKPTPRVVLV